MLRANVLAVAVAAAVSAGCGGGSAGLMIHVTSPSMNGTGLYEVDVGNVGTGTTAPLTVTFAGGGALYVASDDCTGHVLASQEVCLVRIGWVASTIGEHDGTFIVDDGHGVRATAVVPVTPPRARFQVDINYAGFSNGQVPEGETLDATVNLVNVGNLRSGKMTVDFMGTITKDLCTGFTVGVGAACSFIVPFTAPFGNNVPVIFTGSARSDDGVGVSIAVPFEVLGSLSVNGTYFGLDAAAGATSKVELVYPGTVAIGPVELSIGDVMGTPAVDYPPFVIVAGQDGCSGQTLSPASYRCTVTLGLDPRLPAGGSYKATLNVRAAGETATAPLTVQRGTP